MSLQLGLFGGAHATGRGLLTASELVDTLKTFEWQGRPTSLSSIDTGTGVMVPVLTNEFWTSRQRAASSLHEISYRACFKPQLPAFFISRLTRQGDAVYDPFMGRGTTVLEAALMDRVPMGCDVNPLSHVLALPRLNPPSVSAVSHRLNALDLSWSGDTPDELLAFYHPTTLSEICSLRRYLLSRIAQGTADAVDAWIQMVAVNRLTGHSSGFFSVYTLPPNQALSVDAQRKINTDRAQTPPFRDVRKIIIKKTRTLLGDVSHDTQDRLAACQREGRFHVGSCADAFWEPGIVDLVVTSPPFLDVVNYAGDNWLRCWFCGIDAAGVPIAVPKRLDDWRLFVGEVFVQLARLLKPNGYAAFEVGEVRAGKIRLEETVLPCGVDAGLVPVAVVVNAQTFSKTANIWGVSNNTKGTNTNRIVLFQKPR